MKFKRLIPALAMLLVSAILLGTSTFAWFSMNTEVSATGMQVQAVAEDGIVIAAYTSNTTAPTDAMFAETDATEAAAMTNMHPTITADTTTWYHAASTQSGNARAYNTKIGYETVNNVAASGTDPAINYYHVNHFQIKSTGSAQDVYVKEIVVENEDASFQDYSESLRVIVKSDDALLLYAPLTSSTADSFTENLLAATATASTTSTGSDDAVTSDIAITFKTPTQYNKLASLILDDVDETPKDVDIYIFFDGEDAACKSDNIPDSVFETLTVSVIFTSTTPNA